MLDVNGKEGVGFFSSFLCFVCVQEYNAFISGGGGFRIIFFLSIKLGD